MNLQQQRIHALCEDLKLPALSTEWSALAQRAADTQLWCQFGTNAYAISMSE